MNEKQFDEMVERAGHALAAIDILEQYRPDDDQERRRVADRLQYEHGFLNGMEKAAEIMGADMQRWMTDTISAELSCWQEAFRSESAGMYVDHIWQTEQAVSDRMSVLAEIMADREEAAG